jgi:hypothetical protein
MECEAALLTMKACVIHLGLKHRASAASPQRYYAPLMDQIVRWSIEEFYKSELPG